MWLYLSEKEKFKEFGDEDALVWHETNIPYAVWEQSSTRSLSLKYYPSEVTISILYMWTLVFGSYLIEHTTVSCNL